ncbi:MAG: hypothetical protein RSA29_14260 [Clostridium sp.]|uniref:hypothetical protein n=1 Tax=Clostridium sp. TaxID=1506 RepID=UPI00321762CF
MNEKYFNKDIEDKKFYHSLLKNCTDRIENREITFPIISEESKEELNEVIVKTVWDMFYNFRPEPRIQIVAAEVAKDFYNTVLKVQDVEVALQRICEEKDLDVVVITELSF